MEYAGYVQRNQPTDWSKVTGEVAKELKAVEEGREKKRERLDKLYSANSKLVGDVEMGMNPNFNNVVLNKSTQARSMIYDSYQKMKRGEITQRQYKLMMQNIESGWGEFYTAVKQKNNRFAEIEKMQQAGTLGGRAAYLNEEAAKMSTFNGYDLIIGDMGTMAMAKIDPNTGKAIPGSITPMSALNIEQNVINQKYDISARAAAYSARIGKFTVQDGKITKTGTSALEAKEMWGDTKKAISSAMLAGPNDVGDALVDSGQGYYFYQEGDGQEVTDKAIKLVLRDDGTKVAQPEPEQIAEAKKMIGAELDRQVGLGELEDRSSRYSETKLETRENYMRNYMLAEDMAKGIGLDKLVGKTTLKGKRITQKPENLGENIRVWYEAGTAGKPRTESIDIPKDPKYIIKLLTTGLEGNVAEQERVYDVGRQHYYETQGEYYTAEEGESDIRKVNWKDWHKDTTKQWRKDYSNINTSDKDDFEATKETIFKDIEDKFKGATGSDFNRDDIRVELAPGDDRIDISFTKHTGKEREKNKKSIYINNFYTDKEEYTKIGDILDSFVNSYIEDMKVESELDYGKL